MNRNPAVKYLCLTLVLLILLASGLLTACGPSPTTTPINPTTAAPVVPVKTGGILKFWLLGTPAGFDSHMKPTYGPIITVPVFNNIVRFDPTKSGLGQENIIGDLATKWEWSTDGKIVTFTLQKGVTWHDGKPFTADDVVYSIEKMMDPKRSAVSTGFATYDRTEKVDDYTVKVYLKSPSPTFILQLAHGYCPVEAKHMAAVDGKSTDFLMGTGPYKFSKAASGVSYDLVKNPNYFRKDAAGRQLPYLDGLNISIMPDRNASANAVATGRLDMSSPITGVATLEVYNQLKTLNKDLVYITNTNSYGGNWFFNVESPGPLQDIRVRKALTLVCDSQQQIEAAYGSTMFSDPTTGIMPVAYALPKDQIANILGRDLPFDQRVAQAKKLMADAGYATGFKTNILMRTMPESMRVCQLMADTFKKYLNVEAEIISRDTGEYTKALNAKQFQIAGYQPLSMLGEPNDLMSTFLSGNASNFSGYKNAEADKLWVQQSNMLDMAKRKQLTAQIEKLILSDYLLAPQGFLKTTTALQPYVKNYVAIEGAYCSNIAFEIVWLDK